MKLLTLACLAVLTTTQVASAGLVSFSLEEQRIASGYGRSIKDWGSTEKIVINGEDNDSRFSVQALSEGLRKKLDVPVEILVNQVIDADKYSSTEYRNRSDGVRAINSVTKFWFNKDLVSAQKETTTSKITDATLLPSESLSLDSLNCLAKQTKEIGSALTTLRDQGTNPEAIVVHIVDANNCHLNKEIANGKTCSELVKTAGLNALQIKSYMSAMKTLTIKSDNEKTTVVRASVDFSGACEVTSKSDIVKLVSAQHSNVRAQPSVEDKMKAYNDLMGE